MLLTTHALTGAVIGKFIPEPTLIVLLSLAVHYSMDGIRHAEYFDDRTATIKSAWWKVTLDILIGLTIIFLYLYLYFEKFDYSMSKNILLGAFSSMFPDLLTLIYWRFKNIKILAKIKAFHAWAHRYNRYPKYSPERQWTLRNAMNDIIISLLVIILLFI